MPKRNNVLRPFFRSLFRSNYCIIESNMTNISILAIPAIYALLFVMPFWVVGRIALRLFDRRTRESIRCRKCWYDLRGNKTNKCPECGSDIQLVGAWWQGYPKRGHCAYYLLFWLALCAVLTAYVGGYYKSKSEDLYGEVVIRATVGNHAKYPLVGAMAYVEGIGLKMPFIPTRSYPIDEVVYTIQLDRNKAYTLFATGNPLVVDFDKPRILTPGTPVTLTTFEQTAKVAIKDSLTQSQQDAMRLIVVAMDRLLNNGRFYPDQRHAEQVVDEVNRDIGSPNTYKLSVETINDGSGGGGPYWVRYVPAVPMLVVWLVGAYFIARYVPRRGVVWKLPSVDEDMRTCPVSKKKKR
jgi:hypothetical protein